ncbi:hypothetical protein [Botrimarina sp.]|uniref:hypothetical protein n=1 Tax=Botrimarina sp. TaxID=2795802 RepID=UPI0032EB6BEF
MPGWASVGPNTNININNRWNQAFTRPGWQRPTRDRRDYWNGWADGVRHGWNHYHYHHNWFDDRWWSNHRPGLGGWHYCYWNRNYSWSYWWTVPAWGAVTNWFDWSVPQSTWSQPVYYDYGTGGNVVYEDNRVYVGGQEIASAEEFAASAMELATVEPPDTQQQAAEAEWMPLGTFAVSTDEKDTEPAMTVQLAVNREGVVSGTLYNARTDESQSIQGAVDRETQRVAIRFGGSDEIVAETGLYNLTQDEAPVLVHFGADTTENYLLVRLDAPQEEGTEQDAGDDGPRADGPGAEGPDDQ